MTQQPGQAWTDERREWAGDGSLAYTSPGQWREGGEVRGVKGKGQPPASQVPRRLLPN